MTSLCIKVEALPESLCDIDDECKAIYHSKDTFCIWIFKTPADRNQFMQETAGMNKVERQAYYETHFAHKSK